MAMGGTCKPNNGTWEVGVVDIDITQTAKEVFGTDRDTLVRVSVIVDDSNES